MFTLEAFAKELASLSAQSHYCVAYSGGLDSQVLLHALTSLVDQNKKMFVRAVHIHHGLSANADAWVKHCERSCAELKVKLITHRVKVERKPGQSPEEAARVARYHAFAELLQTDECLLTAHTQNDQAETLLLQLLRGAGVKGLAAMPAASDFAKGKLLRPCLNFTRQQLVNYAQKHKLSWIEDESNLDQRFDRNYLRHAVMPILIQRWPALTTTLNRTARLCAEAEDLLQALAADDFAKVVHINRENLHITQLLTLSAERQRNVIRYWLQQLKLPLPSAIKLKQIQQEVLISKQDANPVVHWPKVEIRRYQDLLYAISPLPEFDVTTIIPWQNINEPLTLPAGLGVLEIPELKTMQLSAAITIRFRRGGERCRPINRHESHTLKHLFQEWQIPTWQRARIPLVYHGDTIIAIAGYCICQ